MVNGPPKNESLDKFYPSLGILQNLLMGLGVSDFVSVSHILFVSGSDFKMPISASLGFTITKY